MKIELSLTKDYCPSWGCWEGIREIIQNWLDQRDRTAHAERPTTQKADTVEWRDGRLVATNHYCELHAADLGLLGRTDKTPGEDRGQWGEGLKIGVLALLRAGHGVTIDSGECQWVASIDRSNTFEEDVLMFTQRLKSVALNGVRVTIDNVNESEWGSYRDRFLDLRPGSCVAHPVPGGSVLMGPEERGRVYHKGILVCEKGDDLAHGYNFTEHVRLDRDRSMVNDFDLKWHASQMEAYLLSNGVTTGEEMLERLEAGGTEVHFAGQVLDPGGRKKVAEAFESKYGDDAIAGGDEAGLKGITTPPALREIMSEHRARAVEAATSEPIGVYQPLTLTDNEQQTLNMVLFALEEAGHTQPFELVAFADPAARCVWRGGKVLVSMSCLESPNLLLRKFVGAMQVDDAEVYSAIVAQSRGW